MKLKYKKLNNTFHDILGIFTSFVIGFWIMSFQVNPVHIIKENMPYFLILFLFDLYLASLLVSSLQSATKILENKAKMLKWLK